LWKALEFDSHCHYINDIAVKFAIRKGSLRLLFKDSNDND